MSEFFCGLDLGQTHDPSAFAAVERRDVPGPDQEPVAHYAVRSLHRWPLRTPYPDVVAGVARFVSREPLAGCVLAVDQTGVGRPVVDLLRRASLPCRRLLPVTITAGSGVSWSEADQSFHTAKVVLIGSLQVLLQSDRLKFAGGIPDTPALVKELRDYRTKVTLAANETFNARDGSRDDLLLAVAIAVWVAEYLPRPYAGPLAYNSWAPWPGDAAPADGPPQEPRPPPTDYESLLARLGDEMDAEAGWP